MSEIKLKPCPFCKSENISEGSRIFDFGEDIHIMCRECGAKIQICKEYGWDELRKRWNRRAGEQNELRFSGGENMKRLYIVTMSNGDQYGVPAEVIADNYAKYYEGIGEDYKENYDAMIEWFDTNDFEFADWVKNNMYWVITMSQILRMDG